MPLSIISTSTLINQNISARLLVHTYTADAMRKIQIRIFIDQIVGGGAYGVWLEIQYAGAGSFYEFLPLTSATPNVGTTSVGFYSVWRTVNTGDVIRVYVDGQPGDVATPDIHTEIFDESWVANAPMQIIPVPISTTGPTIYTANTPPIKNSAFVFYLSLISQADTDIFQVNPTLAAGDVTIFVDGVALGNITALPSVIGAGKIVRVALTAAEMNGNKACILFSDVAGNEWQDGFIEIRTETASGSVYVPNSPFTKNETYTFYLTLISQADTDIFQVNPTLAAGDIKVSIDGGALANITVLPIAIGAGKVLSMSLSAAEFNGNEISIVFSDVAGAEWQDALIVISTEQALVLLGSSSIKNGDEIEILRGDTLELEFDYLGNMTNWTKVWFTVKNDKDVTDAQAIIQVVESNPGVAMDGLLAIAGAAPTALANGAITMLNVAKGNITIRVEAVETLKLVDTGSFYYDVQMQNILNTTTLLRGRCNIIGDATRTV